MKRQLVLFNEKSETYKRMRMTPFMSVFAHIENTFLTEKELITLSAVSHDITNMMNKKKVHHPFISKLQELVYRKISNMQAYLNDATIIENDMISLQKEIHLRNSAERMSYNAAHYARQEIEKLVPDLREHAQIKDVHPTDEMLAYLLKWIQFHSDTVAFGRTCLSVVCTTDPLCIGARRRVTSVKPQPFVVANAHHDDIWNIIFTYIQTDVKSLAYFSNTCKHNYNLILKLNNWFMIAHYKIKKNYEVIKQKHEITTNTCVSRINILNEVTKCYNNYMMDHIKLQNEITPISQKEIEFYITQFIQYSEEYKKHQIKTFQEMLLELLRKIDFRLLNNFAVDILDTKNDVIHSLPPRAFWQVSKNRKKIRKEYTEADETSQYPGAKRLHELNMKRHTLRKQRGGLITILHTFGTNELNTIYRMMEELVEDGFIPSGNSIINDVMLSHTELNQIVAELFQNAEMGANVYNSVHHCIMKMRMAMANKLTGVFESHMDKHYVLLPHDVLKNWRGCLENIRQKKDVTTITLKIITDENKNGLHIKYENRGTSHNLDCVELTNILPLNMLTVNYIENTTCADVHFIWVRDGILLAQENVCNDLLQKFYATEQCVINTLKTHGSITGKCCTCNRVLTKNNLIGTSCLAIINK